jgi:hypothetical protein
MIGDLAYAYTGGTYPAGWAETYPFWSPVYSYIIAGAYENNGASARLGSAISIVKNVGNTYVQRFKGSASGPHRGPCSIVYMPLENRTEVRYEQMAITGYSPVYLTVISPIGDSINPSVNTIGLGASYEDTTDYNADGDPDDRVLIGFPESGEYTILIRKVPDADSTATYSIGISRSDSAEAFVVQGHTVPREGQTDSISYQYYSFCYCLCHADPSNCDGVQNITDVVQTVNVAFRGAASIVDPSGSCPYETTDVGGGPGNSCDGVTSVIDVVKMVNVAFRGASSVTEFCNPCP